MKLTDSTISHVTRGHEAAMMEERWNKMGINWYRVVYDDGLICYFIDRSDEEHE